MLDVLADPGRSAARLPIGDPLLDDRRSHPISDRSIGQRPASVIHGPTTSILDLS
jgi:hypothetical protein